jgi:hypothetical protein
MAAWCSFRDESQYERRKRKTDIETGFIMSLEKIQADDTGPIKEKLEQKTANLLFLKHIAIKQAVKYSKYAIMYAVMFMGAFGIQIWHMNSEIREHEVSASVIEGVEENGGTKDNVKVLSKENGIKVVSVDSPSNSSTYEFVYNKDGEKVFEQKALHVPTVLTNLAAILWLLMIWGYRYIRGVI